MPNNNDDDDVLCLVHLSISLKNFLIHVYLACVYVVKYFIPIIHALVEAASVDGQLAVPVSLPEVVLI